MRKRRRPIDDRRFGRRTEVHVGVPLLRLRLRRHLRGQGQQADQRDRRPGQRVQQGSQLRQRLLLGEDHVRRRPPDHADDPRGQVHEGHRRRFARGELGRSSRPRVLQAQRDVEERQVAPGLLAERPAAHHRRLRLRQVHQSRSSLEQRRPERAPVHGQRRGGVHERVPNRRARRIIQRPRRSRRVRHLGRQHGRSAPHAVLAPDGPQALGRGR